MVTKSGTPAQSISKLDAARRQLVTALRLFFDNRDPASICTLAHAAHEILETLCRHCQLPAFMDEVAEDDKVRLKDVRVLANYGRNFFKHADRDPDGKLDDFRDDRNDGIIFTAIQDLRTLSTGCLPIEAQVFETWFCASFPESVAPGNDAYFDKLEKLYPEFRKKDREELKRLARNHLQEALSDPFVLVHPDTDRTEIPRWK